MSFRRASFLAVFLSAACGGVSTSDPGAPAHDASTGADASAADVESDAAIDAPSADATGIDASVDGAATCTSNDVPARQKVEIVVTNTGASDRYLVTSGTSCDAYSISSAARGMLSLALGYQCICECPPPPQERPSGLHRLAPGETFSLSWDATSLVTCSESVDCASMGWQGLGNATRLVASSIPVDPGSYSVSIGALKSVPDDCHGDGTDFVCSVARTSVPGSIRATQIACPSDVAASASFDLPASGDVSVAISLSN